MDYSRYLNYYGQHLEPTTIRNTLAAASPDVTLSATAGFPNSALFPFRAATFDLKDGTKVEITEQDMGEALQYGKTKGCDRLLDLLYRMQCDEHNPPTATLEAGQSKMRMLMSPGAQMAAAAFAMICTNDVPIVFSVPSFAHIAMPMMNHAHKALGVDMDADGTIPSSLRKVMSRWSPQDAKKPQSGIPRILWLNPTCNNPAGVSTSAERRKEIYAIAQEYDLFIVEDDPYYYIQENQPRIPSYLSLDVDGRVLRVDSFAKVIAPGLRCAYVTGPDEIVKRMEYVLMQSCQHTSSLSQIVVYKLLKHWGTGGFEEHMQEIIRFNREKRLHALEMASKYLKGLAEWNIPPGGMYVFFKVHGTGLMSDELNARLMDMHKVAVIPASGFYPKEVALTDVAVLRVSIAMADADTMEKVMKGLAQVIEDARTTAKK